MNKPARGHHGDPNPVGMMVRIGWSRRNLLATILFSLAFAVPLIVTLALTGTCAASPKGPKDPVVPNLRTHRVVFQVNSDDPTPMKHAVTNALNLLNSYKEKNKPVSVEIVAHGPGVRMFRADTSPVKDLLRYLRGNHPDVTFSLCGNTKMIMEKNEGHPLSLVDGTQIVPFGVARLVELQEAGWSYLRP